MSQDLFPKPDRPVDRPSAFVYRAELVRVVDGDTIDVDLFSERDVGFGTQVESKMRKRLRLLAIDAPEVHNVKRGTPEHDAGMAAKVFVEEWFAHRAGMERWVQTFKDHQDKYGRYMAVVWTGSAPGQGVCLNQALIDAGHAKVSTP